jgi:hypothetical protein
MVGRKVERRRQRVLLLASVLSLIISWSAAALMFRGMPATVDAKMEAIDCREIIQMIDRIKSRKATRLERMRVQTHLNCCPNCQRMFSGCRPYYGGAFCKD